MHTPNYIYYNMAEPSTEESRAPYTPLEPYVTHLKYDDGHVPPYEPFSLPELGRCEARFELPAEVDATVEALSELFLPDHLIECIVRHTNAYAVPQGGLRRLL